CTRGHDRRQCDWQRPGPEDHAHRQPGHPAVAACAGQQGGEDHVGLLLPGGHRSDTARAYHHAMCAGAAPWHRLMGLNAKNPHKHCVMRVLGLYIIKGGRSTFARLVFAKNSSNGSNADVNHPGNELTPKSWTLPWRAYEEIRPQ